MPALKIWLRTSAGILLFGIFAFYSYRAYLENGHCVFGGGASKSNGKYKYMSSYKEPSFQERTALANKAKLDAVKQLRAKPPVDEATLAARREAADARALAQKVAREEKQAARDLEKAEKLARAQEAAILEPAAAAKTEEERKLDRDAKYAARKNRKGKK